MRLLFAIVFMTLVFSCKQSQQQIETGLNSGQNSIDPSEMSKFYKALNVVDTLTPENQGSQVLVLKNLVCQMYGYFLEASKSEASEEMIQCSESNFSSNGSEAMKNIINVKMRMAIISAIKAANPNIGEKINEATYREIVKVSEDALPFLEFSYSYISNAFIGNYNFSERQVLFNTTKRQIYSVIANGFSNKASTFSDVLKIIGQFLTSAHKIEWFGSERTPDFRLRPKNTYADSRYNERSKKQASWLFDVNTNSVPSNLDSLSYKELGDLEVAKIDPWFYQYNDYDSYQSWNLLEGRVTRALNRYYGKKGIKSLESGKKGKNYNYDIQSAKKILVFDSVSDSATSAKINTVDAWGIDWKLKWSVEAQAEPVANRLYMGVGGKFSDLVYANRYGDQDVVLVLTGQKCKTTNNTEIKVDSKETLSRCLFESKYNFYLDQFYTPNFGQLLNENSALELVRRRSPFEKISDPQLKNNLEQEFAAKLVGGFLVSFKESMAEMKPKKVAKRGGPVAMSQLGIEYDRSLRGQGLFHIWIANKDAKDENSKSVLFEEETSEGWKSQYYEYVHDLGYSMGASFQALEINGLAWLDGVTLFSQSSSRGNYLVFPGFELYHPKAWNLASFDDGIWMAKRIGKFNTDQIREIVKASQWPKFLQDVLVTKLVYRANFILKAFSSDPKRLSEPLYGEVKMSLSEVYKQMQDQGMSISIELFKNRFNIWARSQNMDATSDSLWNRKELLVDGKLQVTDCEHSYIINFLEHEFWPTGFVNRANRKSDNEERKCKYLN